MMMDHVKLFHPGWEYDLLVKGKTELEKELLVAEKMLGGSIPAADKAEMLRVQKCMELQCQNEPLLWKLWACFMNALSILSSWFTHVRMLLM